MTSAQTGRDGGGTLNATIIPEKCRGKSGHVGSIVVERGGGGGALHTFFLAVMVKLKVSYLTVVAHLAKLREDLSMQFLTGGKPFYFC